MALELRPYLEHRDALYAALRYAVENGYEKQSDFADEVGKSTQEVNLRLRRAEDSKGYAQTAPLDYLATFALRPAVRELFLHELAKAWGYQITPVAPPTAAEMVRALAAEMTDKQKRRLERERGWPEGWLDR